MIKNWMNWEPSLIILTRNLHVPDHIDKCLFIFRTNKWVFFFWITFWFWQGHIRTVKSFAFTQCWLTTPEYLSACGRCSIKDQKVHQHMENRFCCEGKSMFQPFIPKQTMNRLSDPTEVVHTTQCWLTTPELLSTCGRCSIKDQNVHQQLENRGRHEGKSML